MVTVVTIGTGEIEETRLMADTGMVTIRRRDGRPWLGVSNKADADAEPDLEVELTDRQAKTLVDVLSEWQA